MKLHHLLIRVHRILGTVLSILFLMWFLTGMVMMYHTYPSLTQQQLMEHAERIEDGRLKIENSYTSDSAAHLQSFIFNLQSSKWTPYAKPLFRWHHLFGLTFGFFVLTWIFSGFMSLADAPRLIWPVHGEHSAKDICTDPLTMDSFRLDCSKVVAADEVKRLEWLQLGDMLFYHVWTAHDDYLADAADTVVRRVILSEEQCRRIVQSSLFAHGGSPAVTAALLTAYDNYYVSQKRPLPLPVVRVTVDDADGSTYYINPRNGDCRYYNDNRRAGKWMYTGLHALNTAFFSPRPGHRRTILWLLLFGGSVASLTGVILAVRRIKRLKK